MDEGLDSFIGNCTIFAFIFQFSILLGIQSLQKGHDANDFSINALVIFLVLIILDTSQSVLIKNTLVVKMSSIRNYFRKYKYKVYPIVCK